MATKRWIALGIAGSLFIVSIIIHSLTFFITSDWEDLLSSQNANEGLPESVLESGTTNERIAVVELNGTIQDTGEQGGLLGGTGYNHTHFMNQLNQIKDDASIKGVVLSVNTPGGGVVESAEIHDKLVEIKEKKKKIYVSMGAQATSGGYYVSAPADKIFATKETMTGSLGVIMQSINYSQLAENLGVEFVTITSGEFKDMLSPTGEVQEEDIEIVESMLNDSYDGFVEVIANGRGLSEERVREIADGRIYNGIQALELDLIDDYGYEEDVIAGLKKDLKIPNGQVINYEMPNNFGSLFTMQAQKLFGGLESQALTEMMNNTGGPRPMYLYAD